MRWVRPSDARPARFSNTLRQSKCPQGLAMHAPTGYSGAVFSTNPFPWRLHMKRILCSAVLGLALAAGAGSADAVTVGGSLNFSTPGLDVGVSVGDGYMGPEYYAAPSVPVVVAPPPPVPRVYVAPPPPGHRPHRPWMHKHRPGPGPHGPVMRPGPRPGPRPHSPWMHKHHPGPRPHGPVMRPGPRPGPRPHGPVMRPGPRPGPRPHGPGPRHF